MAAVEAIAHDGWAELVLNRPERRNAIDGDLAMALAGEPRALDTDDATALSPRVPPRAACLHAPRGEANSPPQVRLRLPATETPSEAGGVSYQKRLAVMPNRRGSPSCVKPRSV